jgi:hypothetical protein
MQSKETNEESYSPYCKICEACGEEGCCSAMCCQQDPEGDYCQGYLMDLKFAYVMYREIYNMVYDDPKYKEKIEELWHQTYDNIYKKEE